VPFSDLRAEQDLLKPTDLQKINKYHEARIRTYGPKSSMALGWNTRKSQEQRFEVLSQIADLNNHSILDIGCGRGDLRAYLGERFSGITYTGIEQNEIFLDLAIKQYGHLPQTDFTGSNFWTDPLPPADYILASGSLNYKNSDPGFVYKMIRKLYDSCAKAVGFNLLSSIGYPPLDLCAYPPQVILAFCQSISSHVEIRDGYQEGDYSVFMYKSETD
jgi:SAM-dependent methyltransferase